jgi:hypothetical protein
MKFRNRSRTREAVGVEMEYFPLSTEYKAREVETIKTTLTA